jgi:thioredoxin reductase (NADPH)
MPRNEYEAVVIGAGPAGLSAAVYLGRFLRRTAVIDAGDGRSAGRQRNENYLGFPRGVAAATLRARGEQQARRFGAEFIGGRVESARRDGGRVCLSGGFGEVWGDTVIVATGVTDIWPRFPGVERHVGRSLFWCITCDGYRTRARRLVVIGADDESTTTVCQFLRYTDKLTFVATGVGDECSISDEKLETVRAQGIPVLRGEIERAHGRPGALTGVTVAGQRVEAELIFSLLGSTPNSRLAAQLGVLLDERGYVRIDREQRTNVPRVYAAGDVSGPYSHQIASAVHEGSMAAQAANFDLYDDFQRE